jgi:hypothetical protein
MKPVAPVRSNLEGAIFEYERPEARGGYSNNNVDNYS